MKGIFKGTGVYPPEQFFIPFGKLCILGHSTVLCFLVVKSFIVVNDGKLRIITAHNIVNKSFYF